MAVRRHNLLKASRDEDRAALLTRIVWERQLELRVAANFLLDNLRGEEGLCLEIASHFPPRETLALTTGFAKLGHLVPEWNAVALQGGRFVWRALHGGAHGGAHPNPGARVHGAARITDGIVRIDCAVVSVGGGRFVVAGGCDTHPSRAQKFFASAFIYDALTNAVEPLPDMPCTRHGCAGAFLGGRVYVLGGEYVARTPDAPCCVSLDLRAPAREWSLFGNFERSPGMHPSRDQFAFVPVAAAWGRLVFLNKGVLVVFNPLANRWSSAKTTGKPRSGPPARDKCPPELGTNAQASVEGGSRIIFMSGRGEDGHLPCRVYSFQFLLPPTARGTCHLPIGQPNRTVVEPLWAYGEWSSLGEAGSLNMPRGPADREVSSGRVGGALSVVQDRLYVSGGVDEFTNRFDGSIARWDGRLSDLPPSFYDDPRAELLRRAEEEEKDQDLPFDATHELAQQIQNYLSAEGRPGVPRKPRDCEQPWTPLTQAGLALPTAMHAHAAITIPLMPGPEIRAVLAAGSAAGVSAAYS